MKNLKLLWARWVKYFGGHGLRKYVSLFSGRQKCGPRPKLYLWLNIFSTFRGVYILIFPCALYCYWLCTWGTSEFFQGKAKSCFRDSFLVVLSLVCLVTTEILICGNQTIWRLLIVLRTIVAALLKTKYNSRFVKNRSIKKRERNISQWCKWSWKMRFTNILLLEQHLMPDYAHPAHPQPLKHTDTHQQKGHCLPNDLCPSYLKPHTTFFPILITRKEQVFLSHNSSKIRENLFSKSWKFT